MARFAGFRALSALKTDALDFLARALVAHLHLFKSCAARFGRRPSVIRLWLAHRFPRQVRLCGSSLDPNHGDRETTRARESAGGRHVAGGVSVPARRETWNVPLGHPL
jgi:hypothetical protein